MEAMSSPDPRRARSQGKLLDAASSSLLLSGGAAAVTVDEVGGLRRSVVESYTEPLHAVLSEDAR